jgi:hypothetical protein
VGVLAGIALAGLLAVLTACQDLKSTLGSKHHYLLFCVATAMKPRMLLTLDGEGQMLSVPVRLGQAVDVVAQAGRPKTITGGVCSDTASRVLVCVCVFGGGTGLCVYCIRRSKAQGCDMCLCM